MIHCYTGNGKGKTTAALGLALRALGAGKKVAWVAFDKGGAGPYSERKIILDRLPEIEYFATGRQRFDQVTRRFRFGVEDEDHKEGERGLDIVSGLMKDEGYDLIVLDEINVSTSLGIVDERQVLDVLKQAPERTEIVLTGRNAPQPFLEISDLVTEMKEIKHYIHDGVMAREGIDF